MASSSLEPPPSQQLPRRPTGIMVADPHVIVYDQVKGELNTMKETGAASKPLPLTHSKEGSRFRPPHESLLFFSTFLPFPPPFYRPLRTTKPNPNPYTNATQTTPAASKSISQSGPSK